MKRSCSTRRRVLLGGALVTVAVLVISCGSSGPGGSGRSDASADDPTQENSGQDDSTPGDPAEDNASEGNSDQTESASEDDGRPEGWTDETHGDGAPPDYAVVFAEGGVKRLDITISPEDWQTMQESIAADQSGESAASGTPTSV